MFCIHHRRRRRRRRRRGRRHLQPPAQPRAAQVCSAHRCSRCRAQPHARSRQRSPAARARAAARTSHHRLRLRRHHCPRPTRPRCPGSRQLRVRGSMHRAARPTCLFALMERGATGMYMASRAAIVMAAGQRALKAGSCVHGPYWGYLTTIPASIPATALVVSARAPLLPSTCHLATAVLRRPSHHSAHLRHLHHLHLQQCRT